MKFPRCYFCWHTHGRRVDAGYLAAQSSNGGKTLVWRKICKDHLEGWNEGGDWQAPVYALTPVTP